MKDEDIKEVTGFDEMKNPGNFMRTHNQDKEEVGIVIKCACGDIIGLNNKIHTINIGPPLNISPSIGHYNDKGEGFKCHYFIKDGKYVQA